MKDAGSPTLPADNSLIPPGSRVLCAVSGGADSVCLLHLLSRREDVFLVAAHFNHQLRGAEADRDEQFVRDLCTRWGIPLTVGRGEVRTFAQREGLSLEEAARTLRYAFLSQAAETEGCGLIATGHNADDNAETMLLNLIRGTGVAGLAGIPPVRGKLVRPLLSVTREEITAYLEACGLPHAEDSTNPDPAYSRNRIRAQVMPVLRALNPQAVPHMGRAARELTALRDYLDQEARRAFVGLATGPGWASLPWETLQDAPEPLQPRLVFLLWDQMGVGRKDLGAVHLEAVLALENERTLHLPRGITAQRQRGRLFLERRKAPLPTLELLPNVPTHWGSYTLTLLDHREREGLALSTPAEGPLTVGPCPPAGRLWLPGAKGSRTVKRLCLDRGIPLSRREGLPAIYAGDRLAAVWELGVDMEALPAGGPCRFIQVIKHREEEEHEGK